jgi:hypothetical protein
MKQCPQCKKVYSDDLQIFCLDDGAILLAPSEVKANSLNLKTTDPLFKFSNAGGAIKNSQQHQRDLLYLGLGMCLCSAVSIALLNEPNTKKLLRESTAHVYEVVMGLMIIVFLMGMVTSYVNVRQALSIRNTLGEERQ